MERVYSSAELMAAFCPSLELAVKHAIHEQISAYRGATDLLRRLR